MLFNSWEFIAFFTTTAIVYYLPIFRKFQLFILVAASLFFYAHSHLHFLYLLIISAILNSVTSYIVYRTLGITRKAVAILGVISNLGILALFKYGALISQTFLTSKSDIGLWLLSVPLPIGISFYTFQGISLVIDVFKCREDNLLKEYQKIGFMEHLITTTFFISFFPHSIAGPIVKAHDFLPQIQQKSYKNINWEFIFETLVLGYFLKMVIADNLQNYTFWMAYPYFQEQSSITLIALLFGFSFQIFADFAGYSLIAVGTAAVFGYRLPNNFNFPYISISLAEFWNRWHISLSSWLKTYLYIPLGGNRKGAIRTYINLMIVMFLGGLWHGAAWSYLVWGGVHGLALAVERLGAHTIKSHLWDHFLIRLLRMLLVFCFVSWAWLLFKLPEFNHVLLYCKSIITNTHRTTDSTIITYIALYSVAVLVYHAWYLFKQRAITIRYRTIEAIIYGLVVFLILMNSGETRAFIYFQF